MWKLRFMSTCIQAKPELHVFFGSPEEEAAEATPAPAARASAPPAATPAVPASNPEEKIESFIVKNKTNTALARLFSAHLIAQLADNVLQRFRSQLDITLKGPVLYHRLSEFWATSTKATQPSNEERLLAMLAKPLQAPDALSVDAFLREIQEILHQQPSATIRPFVERLLLHHVLQQLSARRDAFPWSSTIVATFLDALRSDAVRKDPLAAISETSSLQAASEQIRVHVNAAHAAAQARNTMSTSSTRCTFCGRTGHSATRCFDAHPELKKPGKSHKGAVVQAAVAEPTMLRFSDAPEYSYDGVDWD
jgi:hypothetical protein